MALAVFPRACLAVALLFGSATSSAIAASFEVRSCAASSSRSAAAWSQTQVSHPRIEGGDWCVSRLQGSDGEVDFGSARWIRPVLPANAPAFATTGRAVGLSLDAPPASRLTRLSYERRLQSLNAAWTVELRSGTTLLEKCEVPVGAFQCPDQSGGSLTVDLPPSSTSIDLAAWCAANCSYGAGPLYEFAAVIYSSVVTVEENVAPTVGGVGVAGTNAAGWLGAGATASVNGSDTLGLRRLEVVDSSNGDAVVGAAVNSGCVDWSVLPCSEPSAGLGVGFSGTVAIGALADGAHQLRARAIDAAGNPALSAPVAVKVDRTAPVAVPTTSGGVIAGTSANFAWNAPVGTQHAPITAGRLKICTGPTAASLTCTWQAGVGASGSSTVPLGNDGDLTTVQVELTDEAGNVGLTPAVQLHRDTTAPAAPTLSVNTGANGRAVIQVNTADTDIAGYALRYCGPNGCADSRRPTFGFIEVDASSPGQYRAEVALVDNAGNIGPTTVATFDRATTNPPPPTTPPAPRTAIKLTVTKPIRLGSKRVALRGKTQAGSTSRITVSVTGRPAGRKRSVTKKTSVKPNRLGAWKLNAALPSGIPRGRKLTIKISAAPTERFTAATRTYTRRR